MRTYITTANYLNLHKTFLSLKKKTDKPANTEAKQTGLSIELQEVAMRFLFSFQIVTT